METEAGNQIVFRNREQAAKALVEALRSYRGKNPLILAIPRGAVPMAKILAEDLEGELDVVLVHKLGAPGQPELAIGAVDETGFVYWADHARAMGIPQEYLQSEKEEQLTLLRKRRAQYTPIRPPIDPEGRITVVLDDGIATGSTMIAALQALRAKNPSKLIAATAVSPPETLRRLGNYADEVVCLAAPGDFYAVGQFFEDFSPVSDSEVIQILANYGNSLQKER